MTIQNQTQLQRELDRRAWSGGYVEVDPDACPILIDRRVTIRDVTIVGQHRVPACYPQNRPTFEIAADLNVSPFSYRGSGGGMVGCSIKHLGQTDPANIRRYPPTILSEAHEHTSLITVRDCTFVNSYGWIEIGNGRFEIDRCYGQPLGYGVWVKNSADTSSISNCRMWPYWNMQALDASAATNVRAFIFERSDWTILSNNSIFGTWIGIQTNSSERGYANLVLNNMQFDNVGVCFDLYQMGEGGLQATNSLYAGNSAHVGGGGPAYFLNSAPTADIRGPLQFTNVLGFGEQGPRWQIAPHNRRWLRIVNEN